MDGKERIKVFASCPGPELQLPPGELAVDKKQIQVACRNNTSIYLLELQRPGKARVKAEDFLRGYKFRQNNLAAG
jgi:methionyl-tRNA formyltransferase